MNSQCKHCGVPIIYKWEDMWHEVGGVIFPQYCRTGVVGEKNDGGGYRHEPKEGA